MIAYCHHIGATELVKEVALPLKLVHGAIVGQVAVMHHKVDAVALVDASHKVASVVVAALRVACGYEAYGVAPAALLLNELGIDAVDVGRA